VSSPILEIVDALRAYADQHPGPQGNRSIGSRTLRADLVEDRRAHVRLRPVQLDAPVLARLKPGPLLTLIDVSAGGALIETPARLTPGAHVLIEFLAPGTRRATVLRSRVIRAQVASLDESCVRYRGACSFEQMLRLADLMAPEVESRHADCTGLALRTILEPHVANLPLRSSSTPAHTLRDLRRMLANTPVTGDEAVTELLDDMSRLAPRCESRRALMAYVDEWLRRRVPLLALRIKPASARPSRADGPLTFTLLASDRDGRERVDVEFRPACVLDDSQVRLLEAGACIISLLSQTPQP
jgi:hypothetical protein